MNPELQAIKDAWDAEPRDETMARNLADAYVLAHPAEFTGYEGKSVQELVADIDRYRVAEFFEDAQRVETWLLHKYKPQQIGGTYQPQIRSLEV